MFRGNAGAIVTMTSEALKAYGWEYRSHLWKVTHVANKFMPFKEFMSKGKPQGYHPNYELWGSVGPLRPYLYDLEDLYTGERLSFSLYDFEVVQAQSVGVRVKV